MADWSVSSSDNDEEEGSVSDSEGSTSKLTTSRNLSTTKPVKKARNPLPTKSQSTSTLWRRKEVDMESSYWDDYQVNSKWGILLVFAKSLQLFMKERH